MIIEMIYIAIFAFASFKLAEGMYNIGILQRDYDLIMSYVKGENIQGSGYSFKCGFKTTNIANENIDNIDVVADTVSSSDKKNVNFALSIQHNIRTLRRMCFIDEFVMFSCLIHFVF